MNTNFALLARFESPIVALEKVCVEFFGVEKRTAESMVKQGTFPMPTFKLRAIDNQRCPTMIRLEDLAKHIDAEYQKGEMKWQEKALLNKNEVA